MALSKSEEIEWDESVSIKTEILKPFVEFRIILLHKYMHMNTCKRINVATYVRHV